MEKRAPGRDQTTTIPVALAMTPLSRVKDILLLTRASARSQITEQASGKVKTCLPQDGQCAERRLDAEEISRSSISIGALPSQLLGCTQRPIQEFRE